MPSTGASAGRESRWKRISPPAPGRGDFGRGCDFVTEKGGGNGYTILKGTPKTARRPLPGGGRVSRTAFFPGGGQDGPAPID